METVFFKSVSYQLYQAPELHFQIRMAGISHLNDHPELYIDSISSNNWGPYIGEMSTPGTWCDNIITQAVSNAHNRVIYISLSQILINEKIQLSLLLLTRDNYEQYSLDILMGYIMFHQFQKKNINKNR